VKSPELAGFVRPFYLMTLRGSDDEIAEYLSDLGNFQWREIDAPNALRMVLVRSPHTHEIVKADEAWNSIELNLEMNSIEVEGFNPESRQSLLTGKKLGSYYPILRVDSDGVESSQGKFDFFALWDYSVVRANDDEWESALSIIATCLCRSYVLADGFKTARALVRQVNDEMSSDEMQLATIRLADARRVMLADLVCFDIRPDLYWGSEYQLLESLYVEWNMASLENASQQAIEISSRVLDERLRIIETSDIAKRANRLNVLLLIVSLFGGISAALYVVDFAVSSNALTINVIRGAISITLAALVIVIFLFTYRRGLSRDAKHG
jgi:hypothetical protein